MARPAEASADRRAPVLEAAPRDIPIATRAPSTTIDALEKEFARKKNRELEAASMAGGSNGGQTSQRRTCKIVGKGPEVALLPGIEKALVFDQGQHTGNEERVRHEEETGGDRKQDDESAIAVACEPMRHPITGGAADGPGAHIECHLHQAGTFARADDGLHHAPALGHQDGFGQWEDRDGNQNEQETRGHGAGDSWQAHFKGREEPR